MGADIHAHIEVVRLITLTDTTATITEYFAQVSIARDYTLFEVLAGIRHNPQLAQSLASTGKAKGFPPNISSAVHSAITYQIDDELSEFEVDGYCSAREAQSWVAEGASRYDDENRATVTDPDIHTASFMTAKELERANEAYRQITGQPHYKINAVIAAMTALNNDTCESRFVFWFKG
jgi:hypothetical protein